MLDDPSRALASLSGGADGAALIAEFENGIRRERQHDGINKAKAAGAPKPLLTLSMIEKGQSPASRWVDRIGDHAPYKLSDRV